MFCRLSILECLEPVSKVAIADTVLKEIGFKRKLYQKQSLTSE